MDQNLPAHAHQLDAPVRAILDTARRKTERVLRTANTTGPYALLARFDRGDLPDGTTYRLMVAVRGPESTAAMPYMEAYPVPPAPAAVAAVLERADRVRDALGSLAPDAVGGMSHLQLAHALGRLAAVAELLLDAVPGLLDDGAAPVYVVDRQGTGAAPGGAR